jgi:SAM-dependent methyltransferase
MLNQFIQDCLSSPPIETREGTLYYRAVDSDSDISDSFDKLKYLLKKFPGLYYAAIDIFSPVYRSRKPLKQFLEIACSPIVNLGSGNQPKFKDVLNVDMFDYENVDIVCRIDALPFKDQVVGAIMNVAVLEHVSEPREVIAEAFRVLKPGGYIFTVIPFNQPYHASPRDYQRYTLEGIKYLHKDFELVEAGVYSGPISAMLWMSQEAFASILSFGSCRLRNVLYLIAVLLTFPVKYLDTFLLNAKTSVSLAANLYVIARKPVACNFRDNVTTFVSKAGGLGT